VGDLRLDSDDLSFVFVPLLEKQLGVKIPVREWDHVYTVQDAIDLFVRYRTGGRMD
jgi:acyl carrier protein